jgi:hypothetical protein
VKEAQVMRSKKMAAALAAVAGLVVLVPAGAGARRAHASASGCHIRLESAPRLVQAGETALLFGQLKCVPGGAASGVTVSYFERVAGGAAAPIGTSSSDSLGRFQLTTPALEKNTLFYVTIGGTRSAHRTIRVSPKVTISGPPDGSIIYTRRGPILHANGLTFLPSRVTFSGQVSPVLAGDEVVLQRQNSIRGEQWFSIGHGTVGPTGAYSISHAFVVPGPSEIRVVARRTHVTAPGASESISYEIVQAQNPNLTIFSSKNPLGYGEPVTISGEDKAGTGVKLALFARTAVTKSYKEVATTTTTSGGAYSFPVQMPLQNTTYKVVAAGTGPARVRNSAALFEGVKYLLTAAASAESVPQGSPITFAGALTPAAAGHVVYLQVQNPSGIGFHIVDIGVVGETGAYSISYVPFVKGTKSFRVRVPGDPANEGAASKLFSVTVTEAPASALKSEPPHNSTPPSEGH